MFGYTLTLAGVTRIIEVSFIAPKFTPEPVPSQDDNNSEHTLADGSGSSSTGAHAVKTFRHLPPFVSAIYRIFVYPSHQWRASHSF